MHRHKPELFLGSDVSVVAIGSPLAYVEKCGAPISTLRLPHLCDLALDQMNAKTQGRKEWKPQNPSESGFFDGRSDDNSMKDVATEMILFASSR